MKVLGIETATAVCGVAVVEGDALLCEVRKRAHLAHAEHLLELVDRALSDAGVGILDLDGVALGIGPGLFTGLRIGVATVKGLLAGSSRPVAGIPTLEALAWNAADASRPVCPMLDAGKGQVYAALFEFSASGNLKRLTEDRVVSPESILSELSEGAVFLGEGASRHQDLIRSRLGRAARFSAPMLNDPSPSVVARLGLERLMRGAGTAAEYIAPVYLRLPDAEVHRMKGRAVPRGIK